MIVICGCFSSNQSYAQEEQEIEVEQSAEVFLEDYSDEFQENFFEGLKQKGIRNYDRAITRFLECKRLQPKNTVVSFELAKFHLYENKLMLAQDYALEALKAEPENYWYAETLTDVVDARKSTLEDVTDNLPWSDPLLRRNISEIYFLKGKYQTALKILNGLKEPKKYDFLQKRILDSIAKQESKNKLPTITKKIESNADLNTVEDYKTSLKKLLANNDSGIELFEVSAEAMENFPTQPYFYYANGTALNRSKKHKDAIEILETALDYLIDDITLENMIYKELADAYNAIDNTSKANMYLSKIKPGF